MDRSNFHLPVRHDADTPLGSRRLESGGLNNDCARTRSRTTVRVPVADGPNRLFIYLYFFVFPFYSIPNRTYRSRAPGDAHDADRLQRVF